MYENNSGSAAGANISISGGLGYSRLKVVFSSNANRFKTAEIIAPTAGQYWALNIEVVAGNAMILRTAVYRVYGTSLTFDSFAGRSIDNTGAVTVESTNFIRIHKVIGYK